MASAKARAAIEGLVLGQPLNLALGIEEDGASRFGCDEHTVYLRRTIQTRSGLFSFSPQMGKGKHELVEATHPSGPVELW